jgi:regulator of protease activity HflC (stomatin/prohibitin superfamily)
MNNVKLGFGITAGLLLLITIFSSVSFVEAGYRAVVFNKFTGNISKELEPGLNFITPFVCKAKNMI